MQNNGLCDYCAIKQLIWTLKNMISVNKNTVPKVVSNELSAKKLLFLESSQNKLMGFLGVTIAHENFLTFWSETVQTVVGEQMIFL